jgi:hypothetical protein
MQTLSTVRNIRRKSQPAARYAGGLKRQGQISTPATCADGFLSHSFMPLYHKAGKVPPQEPSETDYYQSTNELCSLHGFQPMDVTGMAYPYNILLSHRDIENKLNRQPYETELLITRGHNDKKIALATKQVYEVGNTLYYIPVIPLYRFLSSKENKASGELLLAVMSYLYREAGIPYYRDEGSYMYDEYEYNREYYLECMENAGGDEYEEDIKDILKNEICGDIMHRKIYSPYHLEHFAQTIGRFKPNNALEEECLLVARDAFALFRDFPKSSVFQHIEAPENEEDEVATPEIYISFIGDDKGWVYDNIERSVNEVLGNYAEMALPIRVQVFGGTANGIESLEFEHRLFDLIIDLCNILYGLP